MKYKVCYSCKCEKPINEFAKDRSSKDGCASICKACKNKYMKEWRKKKETDLLCRKCGKVVNNPSHYVKSYRWCRDCYREKFDKINAMSNRKCTRCKLVKSAKNFKKDTLWCIACYNVLYAKRNQRKREYVDSLRKKFVCNCGFDGSKGNNYIAIIFHHIDPSIKKFTIAHGVGSSFIGFNKLKKEVKECVMMCSNCHIILHSNS